ncbi:hypothetical protein BASA50_011168 [Batrachochytrium salamandrivorans]|uniref:Uncharacterized protein n=1 Tax=Batrachochytrium salamandrivorans TaxID=1357716 RepID=A0ABQ8EX23_9FUNG|nr:hypothetical protein BASA50_011168 [Batrachochytrium salamandrivorans]KAH9252340.1 hypothetical protein BASA81_009711 [Batrachochytrium salamandrivorans]KAH9271989.1 hypothetical protein BASA83_005835 [Batrachochytrium salamandrivorans]
MQFFHLFSFVVVASYVAALPQPAGLSSKYSNNADTNLAFGLEARSYQPVLNSQRDSATSVLLKRQDDSEGSPEGGSEESTEDDDGSEHTESDLDTPLDEAELSSLLLSSTIDEAGEKYVEVPESVKAAGAAVGGGVEETLTEYLKRALYVGTTLKEWEEDAGENTILVIKSGLGDEEYAKVEPSLKEANEKLKADASGDLQQVTDAVSAIGETPGSVKPEMETIHAAVGRTLDAYKVFFGVLQTQLTRFDAGENIDKYLSEASVSFVGFSSGQQGLYDEVMQKLETAPSE